MGLFNLFKNDAGHDGRMTPAEFVRNPDPNAVVIDVRTPAEYRAGHVRGARNVDVSAPDFRQQVSALDPAGTYYLYCRSGARSGNATQIMRSLGFEQAHNLGGIGPLVQAGAEVVY